MLSEDAEGALVRYGDVIDVKFNMFISQLITLCVCHKAEATCFSRLALLSLSLASKT